MRRCGTGRRAHLAPSPTAVQESGMGAGNGQPGRALRFPPRLLSFFHLCQCVQAIAKIARDHVSSLWRLNSARSPSTQPGAVPAAPAALPLAAAWVGSPGAWDPCPPGALVTPGRHLSTRVSVPRASSRWAHFSLEMERKK